MSKQAIIEKIEKLCKKINGHEQERESLLEQARQIISTASEKEAEARQAYLDSDGEQGAQELALAVTEAAQANAQATELERQAEGLQHLVEGLGQKLKERRAELQAMEGAEARERLVKLEADWNRQAAKLIAIGGQVVNDMQIVGIDPLVFLKLSIPKLGHEYSIGFHELYAVACGENA